MNQVNMIALRPIRGDDYRADEGQPFVTNERTAELLEGKGVARRQMQRKSFGASPENKMIQPAENKTPEPVHVTIKPRRRTA